MIFDWQLRRHIVDNDNDDEEIEIHIVFKISFSMTSFTYFCEFIQVVIKQLFIKKKLSTNNLSCCYSQFTPLFGFFLATTSTDDVAHVRSRYFQIEILSLKLNLLIVFVHHRMIMEFKVILMPLIRVRLFVETFFFIFSIEFSRNCVNIDLK